LRVQISKVELKEAKTGKKEGANKGKNLAKIQFSQVEEAKVKRDDSDDF
jgi:hypothetical protein